MGPAAGWFPDPSGRYPERWWDGVRWTGYVHDQYRQYYDALPAPRVERHSAPGTAAVDVARFLADEREHGVIDLATYERLVTDLEQARRHEAVPAVAPSAPVAPVGPVVPPAPPLPAPPLPAHPLPAPPGTPRAPWLAAATTGAPAPPQPIAARPPSAWRTWWHEHRSAVSEDLAVHGLAYLGVLLVFAGVFGLLVFAFGEVRTGLRPLAELAIPVSLFGASAFLRRRGAPFVGSALELLGGATLPIVGIATFVDGATPPADLTGGPLVVAIAMIGLALAAAYALVVRQRPESSLRYLVAPCVWLAVAAVGLAFAPETPSGRDISSPIPGQWALVAVVIALTLVLVRLRPDTVLARASRLAALPGIAVAEVVTLVAASQQGWPAGPILVAGLATVLALEAADAPLSPMLVAVAQPAVVVLTGAALGPALGAPTAGAVTAIALVGLSELTTLRRPAPGARLFTLGLAALGTLLALGEAGPLLVSWATVFVWLIGRRTWPARDQFSGERELGTVVTFVLPLGIAGGIGGLFVADTAFVIVAATLAVFALGVRFSRLRDDGLWTAWVPVYGIVLLLVAGVATDLDPWALVTTLGLATVALAAAPRAVCLRMWTVTAGLTATVAAVLAANDVGVEQRGVAIAALALVAIVVVALEPAPLRAWHAPLGHVGLAAHVAGVVGFLTALPTSEQDDLVRTTVPVALALGLGALAWITTAVATELGRDAVGDLLARSAWMRRPVPLIPSGDSLPLRVRAARGIPVVVAVLLVPFAVAAMVDAYEVLPTASPWFPITAMAPLLAGAVAARFLAEHHRRAAVVLGRLGFFYAVLITALTGTEWTAATASAVVVAAALACGPRVRTTTMAWFAWAASALAVLTAAAAPGMWPDHLNVVAMAWGAAAMVGGLVYDDLRFGRRPAGALVRSPQLLPAVVLGGFSMSTGYLGMLEGTRAEVGWWSLALAVVLAVVAWLVRTPAVSTLSWVLVTVAYGALAPWRPTELPWTLVAFAAGVVVVGEALRFPVPHEDGRAGDRPAWVDRWDVPPPLVAAGTSVVALVLALTWGWIPATWIGAGALSVAWAVRRRAWPWAVVGTLLVLAGTAAIGPSWLALALVVTSAVATVIATRSEGQARRALQVAAVLAAGGAWVSCGAWRAWSPSDWVVASSLVGGVGVAALAGAARVRWITREWMLAWIGLPTVAIILSAAELTSPSVTRDPAGLAVAAALTLASVALGLLAATFDYAQLRIGAAVTLAGAAGSFAYALEPTAPQVAAWAMAGAMVVTLGASATLAWSPRRRWVPASLVFGGALTLAALLAAVEAFGTERMWLASALVVVGAQCVLLGVTGRVSGAVVVSPLPIGAAWLVYASGVLAGNPQWFTVPTGLTLLSVVALERAARHRDGRPAAAPEIVMLDVLGMVFVVGASLVQTVTTSVAYGALAVALGAALAVWGALTQVRRRVVVGAGTIALALLLMVVPPLVELVPAFTGPALWVAMATIGLAIILAAAFLERGRATARTLAGRLRELTDGWE